MIKGKERSVLTKELILSKVDDYNIYRHYLGFDFDLKKHFPSPFRDSGKDNNPNLHFFKRDEKILFKDFANDKGGDVFTFVQELLKVDFNDCLIKIDLDMGLGIRGPKFKLNLIKKEFLSSSEKNLIQIETREFTEKELEYWLNHGIYEHDLILNNIYSIEKLWVNKQLICVAKPNSQIRFAYKYDDYLKIYQPHAEAFKWISNVPNSFISGFDQIKHKVFAGKQNQKLFIAGSKKDELILKIFFKDVCSTQNESIRSISDINMAVIQRGYRPENVYICYDSDLAGIEAASWYMKNYGFNELYVPQYLPMNEEDFNSKYIKDWGEFSYYKGLKEVEKYLKEIKMI